MARLVPREACEFLERLRDAGQITVTVESWDGRAFRPGDAAGYARQGSKWRIIEAREPAL